LSVTGTDVFVLATDRNDSVSCSTHWAWILSCPSGAGRAPLTVSIRFAVKPG
jgi:hypothetical protein